MSVREDDQGRRYAKLDGDLTDDELTQAQAIAEHRQCVARWDALPADVQITKHGADAHLPRA